MVPGAESMEDVSRKFSPAMLYACEKGEDLLAMRLSGIPCVVV